MDVRMCTEKRIRVHRRHPDFQRRLLNQISPRGKLGKTFVARTIHTYVKSEQESVRRRIVPPPPIPAQTAVGVVCRRNRYRRRRQTAMTTRRQLR